jgi:PD-(D/E)XK nuclease superfamily
VRRVYSFSRRSTLDRCLRQYFYDYYVSDADHVLEVTRRNRIIGLKTMSGAALLAGTLLHRFIRLSFSRKDLSPKWLCETALKAFDEAIQFARDPRAQAHRLQGRYPPQELVEFSYADLDGEALVAQEREKLKTALRNFFQAGDVQHYLRSLDGYELMPEKRVSGLKENGWAISGQVDLLAINGHGCEVIDWKLGGEERGTDSLQLHIYGTFAAKVAKVRAEDVRMRRVFLGANVVESAQSMDREAAYIGRARLVNDIELMEELHDYGERGREGVFTQCNHANICRRCKFRAICHEAPLKATSLQI